MWDFSTIASVKSTGARTTLSSLRFFTVVAGFVFLSILMMPHPFSFSAIQLQVYFWVCVFLLLLVIAFGLVAFYVGRGLPLPNVGLFVLGERCSFLASGSWISCLMAGD